MGAIPVPVVCVPPATSPSRPVYLQHVRDVEEGAAAAGVQVGLEVALPVVQRQTPAGERHHPPAAGPVQGVQRRPLQPPLPASPASPAQRRAARRTAGQRGSVTRPQHPSSLSRYGRVRYDPARPRGYWDMESARPPPRPAHRHRLPRRRPEGMLGAGPARQRPSHPKHPPKNESGGHRQDQGSSF